MPFYDIIYEHKGRKKVIDTIQAKNKNEAKKILLKSVDFIEPYRLNDSYSKPFRPLNI